MWHITQCVFLQRSFVHIEHLQTPALFRHLAKVLLQHLLRSLTVVHASYDAFHLKRHAEELRVRSHQGSFDLVQNLSKDQRCGRATILRLRRGNAFDHLFGGPVPVGTEKAEGSVHCPRAPTQEPSKGLRPHNRHSQKRKVKRSWSPVSCLSWLAGLGVLSRARVSGFFFSVQACFCLFFFLSPSVFSIGRGRHVPAPGWEGRRVKCTGTDPRTGGGADPKTGFFRYFLWTFDVLRLWLPASEASSRRDKWWRTS